MNSFLKTIAIFLLLGICTSPLKAQLDYEQIPIHDPVMIEHEGTYYAFSTGKGIAVWSSPDMKEWTAEAPVFEEAPDWSFELVPDFDNVEWAPDIAEHDGTFYLYYSVSQFGRNNSAIGVATNETLNPEDPNYEWIDHGPVVQSVPGRDMWNAIDPNLAFDDSGTPWLSFGSFWMGLKIVKLQDNLTEIVEDPQEQEWHTIAARHRNWKVDERDAGDAANPELDYEELYSSDLLEANQNMENGAVEAPFIFKKNGYNYLFVSMDRCCRGLESSYKIKVGRSKNITGPYLDKSGDKLVHGGGTLIAKENEDWAAVGHQAAYTFDGTDYLIFHGYDKSDEGKAKLIIREIQWNDGWPEVSL
ncbi:family 43 glycosylhydrolase [Fodinibius salsisoli]|uniref:Family 43 glycosylhydrolase n=1 Tax=Fodinibius salsisoli TaxID=2820877 RepID=A0ABT3PIY8_9BACT|nr:family 43 glycosylhydrolase [Fodinibius salsisoli]MCW9705901.1 family 43 glycosylhydrolase [Fodinibius salsisoli]